MTSCLYNVNKTKDLQYTSTTVFFLKNTAVSAIVGGSDEEHNSTEQTTLLRIFKIAVVFTAPFVVFQYTRSVKYL